MAGSRGDLYRAGLEEILLVEANRTANGNTGALAGFGPIQAVRAELTVTAGAGTATSLDVLIEDTLNGADWNTIIAFAQVVLPPFPVREVKRADAGPWADRWRVRWVIAGTAGPNYTFGVRAILDSRK